MKSSLRFGRYGSTKHVRTCFIVPPHILESIAFNATGNTAKRAMASLAMTARLTGQRDMAPMRMAVTSPQPKQRTVYDARHSERLPGLARLREGGNSTGVLAVDEAYAGSGSTYDLYLSAFGRNSLDGQGMTMISTVSYSKQYDNAYWNGTQMVYGDGDGELFGRFTSSPDVSGHEMTHAVTQLSNGLQYQGQPGALNESLSDCFGSMVKQKILNQTADKADWVIGAQLFTPKVKGRGIRDMLNPGTAYDDPVMGKDPQPAVMGDYIVMEDDAGGVHVDSGIPNRAFAVACVTRGGFAWDTIGKVWYEASTRYLNSTSDFADMAKGTISIAGTMFGVNSPEHLAVQTGWDKAEVKPAK